jgi:chemotaxis protein CheX
MTGLASDSEPVSAMLCLPAVLDLQAAEPLRAELMALRGKGLSIDASNVSRLGGLCLQILMSARKLWAEDRLALVIDQPSLTFTEHLMAFGNPRLDFAPQGERS